MEWLNEALMIAKRSGLRQSWIRPGSVRSCHGV